MEPKVPEIEIANRVLEERRSQTDLEDWGLLVAGAPAPMDSKLDGLGHWYETLDGGLVWREGGLR